MEAPTACQSKQFSSSALTSGVEETTFASLLMQVGFASTRHQLEQHFLHHFQSSYQQTCLQVGIFPPSLGDAKELQPQIQTNMVTQWPQGWLSPVPQKLQQALVPGVGRVRKSDLVLLRAIHKGEFHVDDENAPDMTALSPDQLSALEAFFDRTEEKPLPFCKSLVHETPIKEPTDHGKLGLRPEMRPPPGLEDVIRVMPRTARTIDSVY